MSGNRILLAYSTQGFPDHFYLDAVKLISAVGYDGVGLQLHRRDLTGMTTARLRRQLERVAGVMPGKPLIIEADGKYLLDPWQMHAPSLLEAEPDQQMRREKLLARTIRAARDLGAIVTISSGIRTPHEDTDHVLDRFAESIKRLAKLAQRCKVKLAIRPATGHLICRVAHFERLLQWLSSERVYLAADVPAMVRGGELPVASLLGRDPSRLACVFVADVGEPEGVDLPPGDGHLHWPALMAGIRSAGWSGVVCVRNQVAAEKGPEVAREVFHRLSSLR